MRSTRIPIIKQSLAIPLLALCARAAVETEVAGQVAEIDWQPAVTVASGPASVGPWRMNESRFHYVDDATVALQDDGDAAVAWADNERQDIFLQRYSVDNEPRFPEPVNVSRSSGIFSWLPRVAFGKGDTVVVVWQEIVFSGGSHGGEIYFARSTDGGQRFSAPENLSQTIHGAGKGRLTEDRWDNGSFDLALGPDGQLAIGWTEYEGALRVRVSNDEGRRFSQPVEVNEGAPRPARGPSLSFAADGALCLVWTEGEDPAGDLRFSRSSDGGESFVEPRTLLSSERRSDLPKLLASEGVLHLLNTERPAGNFGPGELRYARLDEQGKPASEPRLLRTDVSGQETLAGAGYLGAGPSGRLYVAWEHHPALRGGSYGIALVPAEQGDGFGRPRLVPGSAGPRGSVNGSRQGALAQKLAVNEAGMIAVVNSHFLEGVRSQIVLVRGQVKQ